MSMLSRPSRAIASVSTARIAADGSIAVTRAALPASGTAKRPPPAPMSSQVSPGRVRAISRVTSSATRAPGRKPSARSCQKSSPGIAVRRRSTCARFA